MFVGHYSAAFAAATLRKAPKLGTLFVAAQLIDIGFFSLVLFGVERMRLVPGITAMNNMDLYDMPWTHSLAGAAAWGLAFALLVWGRQREAVAGAITGAVVFSHWLFDLLVHRPDLTLAGQPPAWGFGLWNHPMIEMPLEIGLLLASAWYFVRRTGARPNRVAILLAVLFALQAFNWFAPQPTEMDASQSILGLFAYGLAAGIAWWAALSPDDPARD